MSDVSKNILASVLLVLYLIFFITVITTDHQTGYISNREVNLPEDCTLLFQKDSGFSFQGDGVKYKILGYGDLTPLNLELLEETKDEDLEELSSTLLDELAISEKNRPNFQMKYKWYMVEEHQSNVFILIIDEMNHRLFMIERTI